MLFPGARNPSAHHDLCDFEALSIQGQIYPLLLVLIFTPASELGVTKGDPHS
jgi:hypothetical protein